LADALGEPPDEVHLMLVAAVDSGEQDLWYAALPYVPLHLFELGPQPVEKGT
jgi:hypothetical protein